MKVCIARSAALKRGLCGLTNFNFVFYSYRSFLTTLEDTLPMMLNTGLKPLFVRNVMFSLNIAIVAVSVKSFTGVADISFDDQSYSTKICWFPSNDLIGNVPVKSTYIGSFFGL